ncbi:MAG: ankyrin repeat domain-containing protein, partial [Cyanobacteria bacterium]|nr:ankyrin repeat domain-containing protein [Cyanobacteriota bacterium]
FRENDKILKLLVKAGANINEPDLKGHTPLVWGIQSGNVPIIKTLLALGADPCATDLAGKTPLHAAALMMGDPNIYEEADKEIEDLKSLQDSSHSQQQEILGLLLEKVGTPPNIPDKTGKTPLHMAATQENERAIIQLLEAGASLAVVDELGNTPLHYAAQNGHAKVVRALLKGKKSDLTSCINYPNQQHETPVLLAAKYGNTSTAKDLTLAGADPNMTDQWGNTPLHWAAQQGHDDIIWQLIGAKAQINLKNQAGKTALALGSEAGYPKVTKVLLLHKAIKDPFTQILQSIGDVNPKKTPQGLKLPQGEIMVDAMPQILWHYSGHQLGVLAKEFESFFDTHIKQQGYHPNEAEWLLALKHPELVEREGPDFGYVTAALTSITRFLAEKVPLTDRTVKAWSDIGVLTHSFRFWRYDTQSIEGNSLFQKFGFQPIQPRPLDEVFGKGFVYEDKDSRTLYEFRRGYLLASHPQSGTLIIRNSSTHFGRDLLTHPAYYLPYALTKEDLNTFDPRAIPETQHVLHRDLYKSYGTDQKLLALTEGFHRLKEEYRRFKLDTSAFEGYGEGKHFTGHHSPGLVNMVKQFEAMEQAGKGLPDLAFVNPEYPIYEPYGFGEDAMGDTMTRFKLTPAHFNELKDFISGHWNEAKYPDSNWIRFLQTAGVENRAELVMLAPEAPKGVNN